MLDECEARQIAEAFIQTEIQPTTSELLTLSDLEEFSKCWVATYNSRRFVETENFRYALAGNGPLIINKQTGTVRVGLTSQPTEDQLDHY
jgi:hypothetical protein